MACGEHPVSAHWKDGTMQMSAKEMVPGQCLKQCLARLGWQANAVRELPSLQACAKLSKTKP